MDPKSIDKMFNLGLAHVWLITMIVLFCTNHWIGGIAALIMLVFIMAT